jgi:copper chaperone NosL
MTRTLTVLLGIVSRRTWDRASALPASALLAVAAVSCSGGPPGPAALSADGGDSCSTCRMTVSDPRTAAQIAVPGEEPRFFDDVGCLREHLRERVLPADGQAFVADHRTGQWTAAESAVYARMPGLETPMGSRLLAWTDETSRAQDPSARAGGQILRFGAIIAESAGDAR